MTPRERYEANLRALRLLSELRDRPSEASDLTVLAEYEGWADGRVRAHGYDAAGVAKPELRAALELLGFPPESLVGAGGLSAYLTPAKLAETAVAIAVAALGRTPRTVLEPSAGTGRFISALSAFGVSEHLRKGVAVEPDPVFAEILRLRFDAASGQRGWEIRSSALERSGLVAPAFDLVVGNAPFGDWGVVDETAPSDLRRRHLQSRVHDYFLCKSVSLLLPGGVVAMITHSSTMDRREQGVREWLLERAELVGAWRLPAELWEPQGAAPMSDLIVMRSLTDRDIEA